MCERCAAFERWLAEPDDPCGYRAKARETERLWKAFAEKLGIAEDACHCRSGWTFKAGKRRGYTIGPGFHPKGVPVDPSDL